MRMPLILMLLETANKINRDRIQGILRYERLHGPWRLQLVEGRRFEQPPGDFVKLGVRGVIIGATLVDLLPEMLQLDLPMVFFDAQCPHGDLKHHYAHSPSVTSDNAAIGRYAADFLLQKGFTHFAYVEDVWSSPWSLEREAAFAAHIANSGGNYCGAYRLPSRQMCDNWSSECNHLAGWLKQLPKPVAILAAHDMRGRQVLDSCEASGLRVPSDVAVLGVDNDELLCASCNPPMSSILRETEHSGYLAAEMLDRQMRAEPLPRRQVLYGVVSVVDRLSTERLVGSDPLVLRALEFIHAHSGLHISVEDVAEKLNASRRLIEQRFKLATGATVYLTIHQVRMAYVARLLRESDLSLGEISAHCGYSRQSYLALVFRRHFGMTMREYRRRNQPAGRGACPCLPTPPT